MARFTGLAFVANIAAALFVSSAEASPALVVDAASGSVLYQQDATLPWFPASLTKLMTLYVTLEAVRDHKIALDTPLVVSARAASMPPSKMGFVPGTQVTLDNALKMLLVRSANDLAVTVAEGVSGSVEAFADDMNAAAARLGMQESHFVNPNGLPDPRHVSSARDMALLARALYTTFPEHADLFNLGALALGSEIITNHNNLLGRYPGADGMKTGFTCPAGFNIVASATRGNRKLIVVVMGAPTVPLRTLKVSALFDRGFGGVDHPVAILSNLGPSAATNAPDMRDQICRRRGKTIAQFNGEIALLTAPLVAEAGPVGAAPSSQVSFPFAASNLFNANAAPVLTRIDLAPTPVYSPVPVYIGASPGYIGPVAAARPGHSPIGTEAPPATASAYAAAPATLDTAKNPLMPDPAALPIKGRRHAPGVEAKSKAKTVITKAVAEKPAEKHEAAVKPAKKAVAKKTTSQAHSEKSKPAKIKEAKSEHVKEHAANGKSKANKGVAAGAE
jgi:D-alanyl-D-alanine carboxypeptidase